MNKIDCEICKWREQEIGYSSPCPKHDNDKKEKDEHLFCRDCNKYFMNNYLLRVHCFVDGHNIKSNHVGNK